MKLSKQQLKIIKRVAIVIFAVVLTFSAVMIVPSVKSKIQSSTKSEQVDNTVETSADATTSTTQTTTTTEPETSETETETTTEIRTEAETTTEVTEQQKPTEPTTENVVPMDRTVYLTFDDGPTRNTGKILDILDEYGVKATFFVMNSGSYNYYMKEIVDRGHQIALHTYTHQYTIYQSVDTYYDDLNKISELVKKETGVETKLIRFPGGSSNTVSKKYCKGIMTTLTKDVVAKGYYYYDWNCTNNDAGGANTVEEQLKYAKRYPKGAKEIVVLMHDKSTTANALPSIIEYYQSQGMKFGVITPEVTGAHHSPLN